MRVFIERFYGKLAQDGVLLLDLKYFLNLSASFVIISL